MSDTAVVDARREAGLLRRAGVLLVVGTLLAGALLLRLPGIAEPSIEQRETQSALLARQWALGDGADLPAWQQRVLAELPDVVRPIEPPILDSLTSLHFRIGGENFWFPRLLSSLSWVVGGVFLFLIAGRLTSRPSGALVALAVYLTWPFAAWLSRRFMPDALMVCCLLAAALTVIRYWERPSRARLVAAGAVAALATLIKPGIAAFFLVPLFVALAVSRRTLLASLRSGRLPAFVALAVTPAAAYYVVGTRLTDFVWSEASTARITPERVVDGSFWEGWWRAVSYLLRYPQTQELLAVAPLLAGLAGVALVRRADAGAILLGLLTGYLAFALTFAGYVSLNPYYSLPLIPTLALAVGAVAGRLFERAGSSGRIALVGLIAVVIGVAAYKSHAVLTGADTSQRIADYRTIGELTGHTTRALVVDDELSTPVMYWGWVVGPAWELTFDEPPPWIRPERAEFLIVVGAPLEASPAVRAYVRGLPVVGRTDRYAVFDLRGRGERS